MGMPLGLVHRYALSGSGASVSTYPRVAMPFKFHEPHRHRVPKARYRVRNWAQYDRGLVARGDIRLWLSAEAIAHWKAACRKTPGGQRTFSNLAIETALTLGSMYGLPLRQCEGFVRSLIELMHLDLTAPDHTTLARRRRHVTVSDFRWPRTRPVDIVIDSAGLKFYGAGEWARAKHGESRRSWRKLHISVNPVDHEIIAFELTDDDTSDASMAGALVSASGGDIRPVIADGADDGEPTYDAIRAARPSKLPPRIVIPPQARSIPDKGSLHGGSQRERHAAEIARHGRMAWQRRNGYGRRSLGETAISRVKRIDDGRLTSRTFGSQQNEIAIHIAIANKHMLIARPQSVRVARPAQSHKNAKPPPCTSTLRRAWGPIRNALRRCSTFDGNQERQRHSGPRFHCP